MAECIKCGSYTKFNGGLCLSCYKSNSESEIPVLEKEMKLKKVSKSISSDEETSKKKEKKEKENPWVTNLIKGRIAETLVEELFKSLDFQVFGYGMENSIPGIKDLLKGVRGDVARNIRQMPDFVVFKDKTPYFIEVKYRASGELKLADITKYGDYPFENALFVLITKKHIKCISFEELKSGKEITTNCKNYLGNRNEFDTDKEKIKEYCKYALQFFEGVN